MLFASSPFDFARVLSFTITHISGRPSITGKERKKRRFRNDSHPFVAKNEFCHFRNEKRMLLLTFLRDYPHRRLACETLCFTQLQMPKTVALKRLLSNQQMYCRSRTRPGQCARREQEESQRHFAMGSRCDAARSGNNALHCALSCQVSVCVVCSSLSVRPNIRPREVTVG